VRATRARFAGWYDDGFSRVVKILRSMKRQFGSLNLRKGETPRRVVYASHKTATKCAKTFSSRSSAQRVMIIVRNFACSTCSPKSRRSRMGRVRQICDVNVTHFLLLNSALFFASSFIARLDSRHTPQLIFCEYTFLHVFE
jgi:hypothetical protein